MTTPLHEIAAAVDAAIERAPLGQPPQVDRHDYSVPGKPAGGLPPGRPRFSWRFMLDAPTRREADGRELAIVDYVRDTEVQAVAEADGSIAVQVTCRVARVKPNARGFTKALMAAVDAARGEATFVVRDEYLFTQANVTDIRAIAPDSPAVTADDIAAALRDALALSASPDAESLAGRFGARAQS
ncbi:MAG: hypothetical protein H0T76_14610 [Nannocystis sp.]|nr:hypothetical protein [Nannocystis sp.]MBA3547714.1 hypothetical protein [Nannocystis sp.]